MAWWSGLRVGGWLEDDIASGTIVNRTNVAIDMREGRLNLIPIRIAASILRST